MKPKQFSLLPNYVQALRFAESLQRLGINAYPTTVINPKQDSDVWISGWVDIY